MSTSPTVSAFALAGRTRDAAKRADAWVWTLQLRAWREPSAVPDRAVASLNQTANYLYSAADALDPPDGLTTYASVEQTRWAFACVVGMLVGVTVLGLTLSGPTVAIAIGVWVGLVAAVGYVYYRRRVRRLPRRIDESDAPVAPAELANEISTLLDDLHPEHGPKRAEAQKSLRLADEWVRFSIEATGPSPSL